MQVFICISHIFIHARPNRVSRNLLKIDFLSECLKTMEYLTTNNQTSNQTFKLTLLCLVKSQKENFSTKLRTDCFYLLSPNIRMHDSLHHCPNISRGTRICLTTSRQFMSGDHFLFSHNLYVSSSCDILRRNQMLVTIFNRLRCALYISKQGNINFSVRHLTI